MSPRFLCLAAGLVTLALAGCAGDGAGPFGSTGSTSLSEESRVKPECVTLSARIETLRKEGVTERAAQAAATGKSATVQVKRASLAQLADLDKANAEFQARCSSLPPKPATAVLAPQPAGAAKSVAAASAVPASTPTATSSAAAKTAKVARPKTGEAEQAVTSQ